MSDIVTISHNSNVCMSSLLLSVSKCIVLLLCYYCHRERERVTHWQYKSHHNEIVVVTCKAKVSASKVSLNHSVTYRLRERERDWDWEEIKNDMTQIGYVIINHSMRERERSNQHHQARYNTLSNILPTLHHQCTTTLSNSHTCVSLMSSVHLSLLIDCLLIVLCASLSVISDYIFSFSHESLLYFLERI